MQSFWQDQGFSFNKSTDLWESECPKCQSLIIGHEIGYGCDKCRLEGTLLDWLWKIKGLTLDKSEATLNFYQTEENLQLTKGVNHNLIARRILLSHKLIYLNCSFYEYQGGVYKKIDDIHIDQYIKTILELKFNRHLCTEIRNSLAVEVLVKADEVNNDFTKINFANGLLNLNTLELSAHTSEYLSTNQLIISYTKEAECPLWIKTLNEIFEDDADKVLLLQQYLGYCLTPDTSFQTALFNIGEGANGKSLIMTTFQNIIGKQNYSTVQMEDFGNKFYLSCLLDKLVNISIESDNKVPIHDANFKAIVSGDELSIEEKFKQPVQRRLSCKLIFSMNDLPRVDDRTDAFFRRIKILRFTKQFMQGNDDRNLKNKLILEYPGIMNWVIFGMKNLYKNKDFVTNETMQGEILDYRKENNNVYGFAEEHAIQGDEYQYPKKDIYKKYTEFCQANGYKPFAIRKFGKELKKACPKIKDYHTGAVKVWKGLGYQE